MFSRSELLAIAAKKPEEVYARLRPSIRTPGDFFHVVLPFIRDMQVGLADYSKTVHETDAVKLNLLTINGFLERKAWRVYSTYMTPIIRREFPKMKPKTVKGALRERWGKITKKAFY